MQFHDLLEAELHKHGFDIDGNINYSSVKFQRFRRLSKRWKGKDLFVIILGGGEGAAFGDWHDDTNWITWWAVPYEQLTTKQKKERQLMLEGLVHSEQAARRYAIHRAQLMIKHHSCVEADIRHPYILAKAIKPLYCAQIRSRLVIPIYNYDGTIQSLQFIAKNGRKRFKCGTSPAEGYLCLGEKIVRQDTIRICEGWATGCSIYESVGGPVIVAFSAENLKHVNRLMRDRYPYNTIVICADNDQWTAENKGLKAAIYCATQYRSLIRYPDFSGLDVTNKPTDFNDLMRLAGLTAMELQLKDKI
jgi:putative DNA primase/helicase